MKPRKTTRLCQKLRNEPTDAERKLWYHLRNKGLGVKFRRQYAIAGYVADFCCIEKKLVIELDGGQHREQEKADLLRSEIIRGEGYDVLRFWNHDVLMNTQAVLEKIEGDLKNLPPPSLPRKQGRR